MLPTPTSISAPLQALRSHLHIRRRARPGVLRELADHIEDRSNYLIREQGLSQTEANSEAIRAFGDPRAVAFQLERIHNQGAWKDAGLGALPNLLVGLLFAAHLWYELEWIVAAAGLAVVVSVIGVLMNRPVWVYQWIGYAVFPVLLISMVSLGTTAYSAWSVIAGGYAPTDPLSWILGAGLGLAGIGVLIALGVWLGKRDWTHSALVVLPLALLAIALLAFDRGAYVDLQQADAQTALLFVVVAVAVGVAIRLGDRLLKMGVLAASLPVGFLFTSGAMDFNLRIIVAAVLSLPALLLILAPLLVSRDEAEDYEVYGLGRRPR